MTTVHDRLVGLRRWTRVPVSKLHRTVTVLAILILFVGTHEDWTASIWVYPAVSTLLVIGYGLMFVTGIVALSVRRRGAMFAVDVSVLLLTLFIRLPVMISTISAGRATYGNDEGYLVDVGGAALSHGLDPYAVRWTAPYSPNSPLGLTATMSGGIVDRFDYPPVAAVLNWWFRPLSGSLPPAAVVATLALIVAAALTYVLLPAPWRCSGPMICFGFEILPTYARNGYPLMVSLPFVMIAVAGWARIGVRRDPAGGTRTVARLGARGWTSAVALGVAISCHQLPWFLAPFLVVGLFVVRAGDLRMRSAGWLAGRYAAVAIGVSLAINLPFMIEDFGIWATGITTPFLAATVPHGQGIMGITYYLVGGSGQLIYFSYATTALLIGLLALFALFPRRLGLAMVIFPWTIFYLATRSQDIYFLAMAPVWIISIATLRTADFAAAWQWRPRLRKWSALDSVPVQGLATAVLLAPATLFAWVAMASPQPLRMRIADVAASPSLRVTAIDVQVTNVSHQMIAPHFALANSEAMSRYWIAEGGPAELRAGESGSYVLTPPPTGSTLSLVTRLMLRAVSDAPVTLSSVEINHIDTPAGTGGGGGRSHPEF